MWQATYLKRNDKYWPAVSSKNGKQITTDEEKGFLNNTDKDGLIPGDDAVPISLRTKQ